MAIKGDAKAHLKDKHKFHLLKGFILLIKCSWGSIIIVPVDVRMGRRNSVINFLELYSTVRHEDSTCQITFLGLPPDFSLSFSGSLFRSLFGSLL